MKILFLFSLIAFCAASASADPWLGLNKICKVPPFEEGEMARFVVKVGFLKVGEGTGVLLKESAPLSEIQLAEDLRNQEMWHFRGRGVSTKPVSLFYKVNDSIESWLRLDSLLPHRQEMRIDETNERSTHRMLYDHIKGVAHFCRDRIYYRRNKKREKITLRDVSLVSESFEIISLFFYLRCMGAVKGDIIKMPLHENGKNRMIQIHVDEIENIKTPLGRKEAIRVQIHVFFEGKLANTRPFKVWVSNDEYRIPLRVVADLKFANLNGVLVGYRRNFEAEIEGELDSDFIDTERTNH